MLCRKFFENSVKFKNLLNYNPSRFAGHSKWANIKHQKAEEDGKRSILFHKVLQKLRIAARDGGGPDPKKNSSLTQAIQKAKDSDVPNDLIKRCLEKLSKTVEDGKPGVIEIKGPKGSFLLVNVVTQNINKTKSEFTPHTKKHKCTIIERSSNQFDHKGIIQAIPPKDKNKEKVLDDAIIVGAEEVTELNDEEETLFEFVCSPEEVNTVTKHLEELNYTIYLSEDIFIPNNYIELTEDEQKNMSTLEGKISSFPNVISIHNNIA